MSRVTSVVAILIAVLSVISVTAKTRPTEAERVELWKRHNQWPPTWQAETDGIKALYDEREAEIMKIAGSDERWENWLQFTQARLVPKFTEVGFEVIDTPPSIHRKLASVVEAAVENWEDVRLEGNVEVIYSREGKGPKFVDIGELAWDTIQDLQVLHEEWGGMELEPTSSYGVRLYQNGSSLVMHHDRIKTHVISSIVHIAHKYDDDNEPWPIQIEDHQGTLHSVNLQPGQMLFYESAKCLHGRMKEFKGQYYGSIFLHYSPVDKSLWNYEHDDVIAAVPPHWNRGVTREHGFRWAGASLTIESRLAAGSPKLIPGSDEL